MSMTAAGSISTIAGIGDPGELDGRSDSMGFAVLFTSSEAVAEGDGLDDDEGVDPHPASPAMMKAVATQGATDRRPEAGIMPGSIRGPSWPTVTRGALGICLERYSRAARTAR